jgi:hypothetical protein
VSPVKPVPVNLALSSGPLRPYDGLPSPSQHSLNEGFGFSFHRVFSRTVSSDNALG